jgi:hypothetical protein
MMDGKMTRRGILVAGGAAALIAAHRGSFAQTEKPVTDLKPGEWSWYPERALSGPVAVLVSLSDQLAFVYRNGIRIGVSTISSGRKGYETPTGVFTVLSKEKMHHSRAYNNAAMPDSQFLLRRLCPACGRASRLSQFAWLRAPSARLRRSGLRSDPQRHPCDRYQ